MHNEKVNVGTQLASLQTIMSDTDRIMEYIESISRSHRTVTVFPETSVQIIAAEIDPIVKTYIATYGIPPNGIFDPDKLAALAAVGVA